MTTAAIQIQHDDELKKLQQTQADELVLLDIREADEYRREHVPGSVNLPLSQLSQSDTSWLQGKTVLVYCKAGMRSQTALPQLEQLGCEKLYCLKEGLNQWKRCGLPCNVDTKAPLDIMRQVQIIVGTVVMLGIIAGWLWSPYFTIISFVMGAGLCFAGMTGFCGMAKLLALLPINRIHCTTQGD